MDAINHIELTLQAHQVTSALQSLLLAIFFHRTLETLEPETREVLETHVACSPTIAIEKEISDNIEEFGRKYLGRDDGRYGSTHRSDKGELALIFTQKKSRKGWFGITEELVPWEAHFITIHLSPSPSPASPSPSASLTEALMRIATFCAERRLSVPSTPPGEANRLSHQILISPPPPSDLFAPSPPLHARSPPPQSNEARLNRARRSSSPGQRAYDATGTGTMGYLEQAKDVLRATGARAGVVAGWTGKARGT